MRACVLDFGGSWSKYLPLMEFSYNNSNQSTIGVEPYEMLYGKKCISLIHWDEAGERRYLGPELVQQTNEALEKIRARMLATQSRQKSYANLKRKSVEFQVGDHESFTNERCVTIWGQGQVEPQVHRPVRGSGSNW